MTVLSKFKSLNTKKKGERFAWLYECHPLETTELDFRLQYLAALALLTALDREPTLHETSAYIHLGRVLDVDEKEVEGFLKERANVTEEDINSLFSTLRRNELVVWNYLADLAWLHTIFGNVSKPEIAAFSEAMEFFGIDRATTEGSQALQLHPFMRAVQTEDDKSFVALRYRTTWPTELDAVLAAATKKMLPSLEKNANDLVYLTA